MVACLRIAGFASVLLSLACGSGLDPGWAEPEPEPTREPDY
jgi:hypothetical protein